MDISKLSKVISLLASGLSIVYTSVRLGKMAGQQVEKNQRKSKRVKAEG